ncbi:hypothetical protein [Pseudomonas gingeri]
MNSTTPQNLFYGRGSSFPGEPVRRALLLEQFHLCAYTMRRLRTTEECIAENCATDSSCHIEHVLPQATHFDTSIAYDNMVACYPPSQGKVVCDFGAVWKKDYDPAEKPFVSPLVAHAQTQFCFLENGYVEGMTPEATMTIEVLNLNASALVNDRKRVIRGALRPRNDRLISAAAARRLAEEVSKPDARQCLPAYCEAIKQLAERYARKLESRAGRLRNQPR